MLTKYQLPQPTATVVPISGRYLAHNHHDRVAHAFMASDLVRGVTRLVKPTVTQASLLTGVNRAYVHWALKRQAERPEIEAGLIPLVPAAPARANGTAVPAVPDAGIEAPQRPTRTTTRFRSD